MQERKRYPQLIEIAARVPPNSELTKEEFQDHLAELDKSLRSVPATAQVHYSTLASCQLHTRRKFAEGDSCLAKSDLSVRGIFQGWVQSCLPWD